MPSARWRKPNAMLGTKNFRAKLKDRRTKVWSGYKKKAERAGLQVSDAILVGYYIEDGRDKYLLVYSDRVEKRVGRKAGSFTAKGSATETIDISKVSSVELEKGITTAKLTVHASGNDITFKGFARDVEELRESILEQMGGAGESASVPATDPHDELRKLAELHSAGVLSDEEFAAKKAELLGRI